MPICSPSSFSSQYFSFQQRNSWMGDQGWPSEPGDKDQTTHHFESNINFCLLNCSAFVGKWVLVSCGNQIPGQISREGSVDLSYLSYLIIFILCVCVCVHAEGYLLLFAASVPWRVLCASFQVSGIFHVPEVLSLFLNYCLSQIDYFWNSISQLQICYPVNSQWYTTGT